MQGSTKKTLPAYVVLALIALVAALVLAVTNAITAGPIAEHQMASLKAAFGEVMEVPEGGSYEQVTEGLDDYDISSLYKAVDAQGNVIGYCVTASKKGYGGQVAVTLGVDTNGTVTGCVIGDTNFAESAGFGSRAQEPEFEEQFVGLDAVNGGTFEKLSGATVTSTAVLNATNEALRCIAEVALGHEVADSPLISFGAKAAADAAVDTSSLVPGSTMRGTAEGFGGGEVVVTFTLDDNCAIANVKVDASTQTAGFGQRCAEDEAYLSSFIGKTLPVDVDGLSGATITSDAVEAAMNSAVPYEAEETAETVSPVIAQLLETVTTQDGTVSVAMTVVNGEVVSAEVVPAEAAAENAPAASSNAEELKASAPGYDNDPVKVVVTLNEDGTVATLTVDASTQQMGIGKVCEAEAFTSQFIGKSGPFTLGENIDACTGATFTSQAVVTAVNKVLPTEETTEAAPAEEAVSNELKASAPGYDNDPVKVVVTLNEDGTVATLTVDASTQQMGIGKVCEAETFTSQFIGKSGPFTLGENIDACTGATFTSQAVVTAVNKVLPAEETTEAAPAEEAASNELKASAPGYDNDPVKVIVTLNEDGTVATLTVDASTQQMGIGKVCEAETFTSQFIGKSGPFTLGENIDACTGATFTSQAVVDAVNKVLTK